MQLLFALQVLLTALLGTALLLTALENGGTLTVPWPFSPEVTVVSQTQGLLGFVALGALWSAVLLLPALLILNVQRLRAERLLAERERHLQALLRAQHQQLKPAEQLEECA
ncbi:hypothetical protein [Deinococcus radiophilus]|uniref:LapA family protein n=1 Tax=Deinococcus radiophilus TaxID=32062 RepID=A0A3S0K9H3_9DEIO|nr:hypothetical protein [Deinococcus radiophilus]RTR25642.1 hypothetical protein EJ104_10000 [Deinococcus radiophilus]UFA50885.1 hypothetical protein LMT64_02970 [Deinococcus radiophilus]